MHAARRVGSTHGDAARNQRELGYRTWITKSQSSNAPAVQRAVFETAALDSQAFVPVQVQAVAASAEVSMLTKACGAASKSSAVSMRIQVQLPNGIAVDLGQARMEELSGVMQMLMHLPCSH